MVAMQGELASAAPTVPPSVRRGLAQAEQEKSGFDPCRAHHEIPVGDFKWRPTGIKPVMIEMECDLGSILPILPERMRGLAKAEQGRWGVRSSPGAPVKPLKLFSI